jgi:hypothetical protein
MKQTIALRMRNVLYRARVRTDVSEERNFSFIRVERFCELGTTLTVSTSKAQLLGTVNDVPS